LLVQRQPLVVGQLLERLAGKCHQGFARRIMIVVLGRGDLMLNTIHQLVVSRIVHRTSWPRDNDELLAHEMTAKPLQFGRFRKIGRQPILDVIRHPLHRHPRPAQRKGPQKAHDADDQQRVTGEKCTFHENLPIHDQE
jgi:hypothetical protein